MKTKIRYKKKTIKHSAGFTLIELLVVIIVISVLSGIAIPSYATLSNRSKESATKSEMRDIATAFELHNADNEVYPATDSFPAALEDGNYMKKVATKDKWGNPYSYKSDGASYTLRSNGIDEIANTDDDIVFKNGVMIARGAYSDKQQQTSTIEIISITSPVRRGNKASISINTKPNTFCKITVYYKSGYSKAKGLEPKYSDKDGKCAWTWKVGTRTTPGDWKIIISAEGLEPIETYFTVTSKTSDIKSIR